ncbi:hypothetical protein JCM10914A_53520 [Paenibacillus sp. JCM 10914]|uniref:TraR/DksA C4-type zinc finger protein n=1 Tax=Paenibacillus sp. JCM 10914 TaxID=1236974 RepID=UPI0003CC7870|nr:TraR/DksA C4-type zinc finger protein [Paenibacillus sp. JCM 10914]GAE04921.1 DnaK suppressor protein [Paenibacillus sp. JCM 10914]
MTTITNQQLKSLRQRLLEDKDQLKSQLASQEEDHQSNSLRDSTGELSAADNHPGDVGTEVFERGRDLALQDKLQQELDETVEALKRIDQGDYGTCAQCGKDIPYERLDALPSTAYCIEHTPRRDLSEDRPVEEDVMTPPPAGVGRNRQRSSGRFDDAGAWDAVSEYGTSTSPGMKAEPEQDDYKKNI